MAALCLLTTEEANKNIAIFKCSRSKEANKNIAIFKCSCSKPINASKAPPEQAHKAPTILSFQTRATALNVPGKAPDALSYFKIPEYHLHVLSTLVSTAMKISNYVPGSGNATGGSPDLESQAFVNFLQSVSKFFSQYIVFTESQYPESPSGDSSQKDMKQPLSKLLPGAHITQNKSYVVLEYTFVGSNKDPNLLLHHTVFKTNGTESEVCVWKYNLRLISASIEADAHIFAAAKVVRVEDLVDYINASK